MDKGVLIGIIVLVLLIAFSSAVYYSEPWANDIDAGGNDLSNVNTINANTFSGTDLYITNIYGSTSWCAQEFTNVSTACGGLNTGAYSYADSSLWLNATSLYDGNFSSSAVYNGTNDTIGYFYSNYSKPSLASATSLFTIKREVAINNYSINSLCFSQSSTIFLRGVVAINNTNSTTNYWQCNNGTQFINVTASQSGARLYEESMVWKISNETNINFTSDWVNLQNYPAACPGSSAIIQLNDSVICVDLWLNTAGDNLTGNMNMTNNNLTGMGILVFTLGEFIDNLVDGWIRITGNLQVDGDLNMTGNFTGNYYYGEMWMYNISSYATTAIGSSDVWYNLTGFNKTDMVTGQTLNGFTYDNANEHLTALIAGKYRAIFLVSGGNAGNNNEYEFGVAINDVMQSNTIVHRKIAAAGDVAVASGTGFIDLSIGDNIHLMVLDHDGTVDMQSHSLNLNLVRVGD